MERYRYLKSGTGATTFDKGSIPRAKELSQRYFDPPLHDLDYLVYRERRRILENWFRDLKGNDLLVLDIGGRIQPYRPLLERQIRLYVAVDLQFEGLIDAAADVECLPFGNDFFDIVICTQVLHYVPNPLLAMTEMHRVLHRGGRLFLTTPSLFPEHHDHLWRFLPGGLRYLTKQFSTVEIQPEGYSAAGLLRAINVTLHRDIQSYRMLQAARKTTIPALNLLGLLLDPMVAPNTRSTANYSVMAIK